MRRAVLQIAPISRAGRRRTCRKHSGCGTAEAPGSTSLSTVPSIFDSARVWTTLGGFGFSFAARNSSGRKDARNGELLKTASIYCLGFRECIRKSLTKRIPTIYVETEQNKMSICRRWTVAAAFVFWLLFDRITVQAESIFKNKNGIRLERESVNIKLSNTISKHQVRRAV